jgi:hypothetical protein
MTLPGDDIDLGKMVVQDRLLGQLRGRLGFPRMLMAEMLYTTIPVYTAWESYPETKIRKESAERIGRFYRAALGQLRVLEEEGVKLTDLVPWHRVAMAHHVGQEVLLQRYRAGEIDALDLGVLGLWGYKEDLP